MTQFMPNKQDFSERLKTTFGNRMFSSIEAEIQLARSKSYVYAVLKLLQEENLVELVQPGSVARFHIWRVRE